MKFGLLPIDASLTQRSALMGKIQLLKLGILPCDAAASQNKAAETESVDGLRLCFCGEECLLHRGTLSLLGARRNLKFIGSPSEHS